jgi:glycosyltransferase involved in cell wall biosynthesis
MRPAKIKQSKRGAIEVCIVQPVQSPYWTARLKILAAYRDLNVTLLLERHRFAHRPGWTPEAIEGMRIEVLNSVLMRSMRNGSDLAYETQSIRSVPWSLAVALWRLRPDVVVLCNATQMLLAWPLKHILGLRLALIVEDTLHATRNLGRLSREVRSWAYRRADMWFAFSHDANRYLTSIGIRERVKRSSWSLDMKTFQSAGGTGNRREERRNRGPLRTVLFVGQLIPRKGVLPLLDAWSQLPLAIRRQSSLLLVGDGPLRGRITELLQQQALDEVQLLGQLPYSQVRALLHVADLFVLPTLEDLFSLTVLEAMACGCPVLTTPFNGARELVDDKYSGWIVDPTQHGALTSCLQHALSGNVDLSQMGRAARRRVETMDNTIVMDQFRRDLVDLVTEEK